jgi:hypothetical protein
LIVWQAGQRTHKNQYPALMATPIVGEKIIGARNGLALILGGDQALGILKHLGIGRAPVHRFLFGDITALILHLAAVETHAPMVAGF